MEKLVRKAYQNSPSVVENMLIQVFVDGIRDFEVRAAVRLGHHQTMKNALAHALEVEAVRQDSRAPLVRAVVSQEIPRLEPVCYECGDRGHVRMSCPNREETRGTRRQYEKRRMAPVCYECGERGHIRMSCPKRQQVPTASNAMIRHETTDVSSQIQQGNE